jgi:hypothetical protein
MNILIFHNYLGINVGNGVGPAPIAFGAQGAGTPGAGIVGQVNAAGFILDWMFYL